VIRSRVEYAIEQLLTHDIALSELAQNAGFANQSHMAKCMKRVAGFTPGSIR
jgi:AraC family transcriptional regulator